MRHHDGLSLIFTAIEEHGIAIRHGVGFQLLHDYHFEDKLEYHSAQKSILAPNASLKGLPGAVLYGLRRKPFYDTMRSKYITKTWSYYA